MELLPLILTLLLPLLGGFTQVFAIGNLRLQRKLTVMFSSILLFGGGWLLYAVHQHGPLRLDFGGWDAPVGIRFYADTFSALMVCITGLIGFCSALHAMGELNQQVQKRGFHPIFMFLLFGINGAFLTGDLFNLFVWFEVMLLSSFVLLAMGGHKKEIEGAIKYVTLNIVASFIFLVGIALVYGSVGSLNFVDIGERLAAQDSSSAGVRVAAVLLFLAFAVKAGLFPIYAWLPSSYHTPSHTVSALFAGLLTKVGVYALFRVFGGAFASESEFIMPILFWGSLATMITGVLGAASQFNARRILSFHIISQIGYMTFALSLGTVTAIAAGVFYTLHHILVKTNLFYVVSVIDRLGGGEELKRAGGLYQKLPLLCVVFLIPALSLGGIPPLSGFWAKLALLKETLALGFWLAAGISLAVGVLTLFSMTKIWSEAFWKDRPANAKRLKPITKWHIAPMVILAAGTIWIGLNPEPLFKLAETAATQLLEPQSLSRP